MATDALVLYSAPEFKLWKNTSTLLPSSQHRLNTPQNSLPEILFITSFPPRECGIATYSQDLVDALSNQFENSFTCSICALESDTEQHSYTQKTKYSLNTDCQSSFIIDQ